MKGINKNYMNRMIMQIGNLMKPDLNFKENGKFFPTMTKLIYKNRKEQSNSKL